MVTEHCLFIVSVVGVAELSGGVEKNSGNGIRRMRPRGQTSPER